MLKLLHFPRLIETLDKIFPTNRPSCLVSNMLLNKSWEANEQETEVFFLHFGSQKIANIYQYFRSKALNTN